MSTKAIVDAITAEAEQLLSERSITEDLTESLILLRIAASLGSIAEAIATNVYKANVAAFKRELEVS